MKRISILLALISLISCTKDPLEELVNQYNENIDKVPSESTTAEIKNYPFRYNFLEFNGITREGMLNWEGKMFDYDNDGIADMVSTGTDIMIVKNEKIGGNLYTLTKKIKLSDYIDYDVDNLWSSQGVVYDFNNDGKMDHFVGLVGEGPGVFNRGGTYLLLSDGDSYKGSVIDERKMFRFDDTFTLIDYNRDGLMDVMADFEFVIYQNNGDGTFRIIDNPFERITTNPGWLQTRVDDLNGDGFDDIIALAFNGLEIHYGTSDYTVFDSWYNEWDTLKDWNGADITITNVDGYGYKEILATYSNWKGRLYTRIFRFDGTNYYMDTNSEFHQLMSTPSWDQEIKTSAWDFDEDGDDDIFFQQVNDYTQYFFENINGVLVKKSF